MAGSTNNPNINSGINQVIQAINDLITGFSCPDVNVTVPPSVINVYVSGGSCASNCAPVASGPINDAEPSEGQTTEGEGPGGYEPPATWEGTTEEYDLYKCKAATWLANAYLNYVAKFTAFASAYTSMTVSVFFGYALADVYMALIGPALFFILFGFIIALDIAGGTLAVYLAAYYTSLNSTKEQFICDLYAATSVTSAKAVISAWIADNLPTGLPSSWTGYHVDCLFPNRVINVLFEEYAPVNDVTEADCSGCVCDAFFQNMTNGDATCTKLNDTDFESAWSAANSRYELAMAVNHDPDDHTSFTNWTGSMMIVSYEVLSGTIGGITPPPSPIRFFDQSSNPVGGGSDPQPETCFGWVIMVSSSPFTVRFACVSDCA